MAAQIVCKFNKFWFCKFQQTCRNHHIEELCDNSSCDIKNCNFRHPQVCKFYRDFGRCKYSDYCAYAHIDKEDITEIARSLRNEIDDLENKVIENEKVIVKYSEKIESLEIEIVEQQNKTEVFMKKLENTRGV